jgi:hypothetical protein
VAGEGAAVAAVVCVDATELGLALEEQAAASPASPVAASARTPCESLI